MTQKEVRQSLIAQLVSNHANTAHFEDLVNDYMSLWQIKKKLIADIKKRGVMYTDNSSVGVPMKKNNPSTKELVMVNRQMLAILKDLNLTTENVNMKQDDNDEM